MFSFSPPSQLRHAPAHPRMHFSARPRAQPTPSPDPAPMPAPRKSSAKKMPAKKSPAAKSPVRKKPPLRITKVYTRTGDKGMTALVSGEKVPKSHPRIESYGTVDELGVWIGQARHEIETLLDRVADRGTMGAVVRAPFDRLSDHLRYIQNLLFTLGGELATPPGAEWPGMVKISPADVTYLENLIDAYNAALPPLEDFILAGGGPVSLSLHHARVVCRRAERVIAALDQTEPVGDAVNSFVNRLSDLFFVLARWVVAEQDRHGLPSDETLWNRSLQPPPFPR